MNASRLSPGRRLLAALLLLAAAPVWGAGIVSTATGGGWTAIGTWVGGVVPGSGDDVTIADGATVTINTTTSINSLTVGQGASGILQYPITVPARILTVAGDVTIASGGTFQSNPAGTTTNHRLQVGGNLTNNGILEFSTNGGNGGATIEFTGAANATFSGPGATTDVTSIDMNKGTTPASVLELMPASFTVQGVATDVAGGWLVMTNGTIKVSGTFTGANRVFATAAYIIPTSCGFWLNNPNYTVVGRNASATNNGLLQITQGTFNVGSSNGNSMLAGADGAVFTIEGGVLNIAGRLSATVPGTPSTTYAMTYNQSGGTVNLRNIGSPSGQGSLYLISTAQAFNMSGGTINLVQRSTAATPWDWVVAATPTITGGTLNVGTAATATNFTGFGIFGYVPNLVIDATTNAKSATILDVGQSAGSTSLLVFANLTIGSGAGLALNGFEAVVNGPTIANDGTLDGTVTSSNLYFGGPTAQTYTGSGTATLSSAGGSSISIDNILPGGLILDPASPGITTDRVNLFIGGITNANKLTLGNGGTTAGVVQIGNAGIPTVAGLFDTAPTFNLGTGGEVLLYLATTAARTTGPEIDPARTLAGLTYDDPDTTHSLTIDGGDLTVNGSVAGALSLANGRVITGPSTLYFSDTTTGTVTRTTGYVDGKLKKAFAGPASTVFEVGTANGYSPVTFSATAGTFPADVTIKATQGPQPAIVPATTALSRYWTVTATGLTADVTFNYLDPTDIPGTATESNFKIFKVEGPVFTNMGTTIDTAANTFTLSGISSFSDWTLAEQAALPPSAVVSGDAAICAGGSTPISAALTGHGPWNVTWSDAFVQPGVATSPATRSVSPGSTATYTVTGVTDAFYPSGTMSGSATVTVNPSPAMPTAGNDGPICQGATLHLSTPTVAGASYSWTGPNGFVSFTQNPSIAGATAVATGTYSVTVTVSGCTSPAGTTSATVNADTTAPAVTAPSSITVDQSLCCGTFGGANGTTNAALATYLAGGSATDDCTASPTRLAPQVSGVDVTSATCFEAGATAVTFRYQDTAGHIGTASSNVTVRMFGDLNLDQVVNPTDMVILRAYVNFVATPGTPPFNAPLNIADLTHDGVVDPSDIVVLRAYFNFVVSCLAP